jgi:hypothetical protein
MPGEVVARVMALLVVAVLEVGAMGQHLIQQRLELPILEVVLEEIATGQQTGLMAVQV